MSQSWRAPKASSMVSGVACAWLFIVVFQSLGVGHWSGDHAIVSQYEVAEHASHCHGANKNCGSGGGLGVGVADVSPQLRVKAAGIFAFPHQDESKELRGIVLVVPSQPPRPLRQSTGAD